MKTRYALLSAFGLSLMLWVNSVHAQPLFGPPPPHIPAYSDGQLVYVTVVNDNVYGVDQQAIVDLAANPIYFVGYIDNSNNWVDLQPHVLSIGLGEAGYNPYWDVNFTVVDPKTFTNQLTTVNDIYTSDEVITNIDSHFILLCQQISK